MISAMTWEFVGHCGDSKGKIKVEFIMGKGPIFLSVNN